MKHTITVVRRSDDYMAYLDGDKKMWACGTNAPEAVGNLVASHRQEIGVTFVAEQSVVEQP